MADINFLGGNQPKDDKPAPKKPGQADVQMHVPAPEAPAQKPPSTLDGLKALFPTPAPAAQAPSAKLQAPANILSPKIPTAKLTEPSIPKAMPPVAPPKPAMPPTLPQPPVPPKMPVPPAKKPESAGGPLRVSLISTAGGGLSDLTIRERVRTFTMVMVLALVIDALIMGGILFYQSRVGKEAAAAVSELKALDGQIAETEKRIEPARRLQFFLKTAEQALRSHRYWTNFIGMIQALAKPDVRFLNLTAGEEGNFIADIRAKDYTTVARQIVAFQRDPRIKSVDFGGVTYSDADGAATALTIGFDPAVLLYAASTSTPATR